MLEVSQPLAFVEGDRVFTAGPILLNTLSLLFALAFVLTTSFFQRRLDISPPTWEQWGAMALTAHTILAAMEAQGGGYRGATLPAESPRAVDRSRTFAAREGVR